MMLRHLLTTGLMITALPHGSLAQETGSVDVLVGGAAELTFPSEGDVRELSAYGEVERDGLYGGLGVLLSNDSASNEIALYLGYRGTTAAGLDHDISYTRYAYPADGGDCCGELRFALGYPVTETLGVSSEVLYTPESSDGEFHVAGEYLLSDRASISADFGVIRPDGEPDGHEWDVGVTYGLNDTTAVDVRYHDSADGDGYLGVAISFDTTLNGGDGPADTEAGPLPAELDAAFERPLEE